MEAQEPLTVTLNSDPFEYWAEENTASTLSALTVRLHSTGFSLCDTAAAHIAALMRIDFDSAQLETSRYRSMIRLVTFSHETSRTSSRPLVRSPAARACIIPSTSSSSLSPT